MDMTMEMSSDWMPLKSTLDRELAVRLNPPFATIKQENYEMDEDGTPGARREVKEVENTATSSLGSIFIENKNEAASNGPSCSLSPIGINHRAQIDVFDMQKEGTDVYRYLLTYEEQYSKFVVLRALRCCDPKDVAIELAEIVTMIGAPRIIQSGNGRAYAEQVVREVRLLLRDFCVVHGDATRNDEERRDFKSSLKSWLGKNSGKQWYEGLNVLQVVENTAVNSQSGKIPSQVFFGRNICEDLRRTIGGKGSKTNFERESSTSSANLFGNASPVVAQVHKSEAEESDKDSRDIEYRENPIETRKSGRSLRSISLRNSMSLMATRNSSKANTDEAIDGEQKSFRCNICQKQYVKLGHLRNHMKTHTRIGNFECALCCKTFRLSSLYEKHMQKFHEEQEEEEKKESPEGTRVEEEEHQDSNSESETECSLKLRLSEEKSPEAIATDKIPQESSPSLTPIKTSGRKTPRKSNSLPRRKLADPSAKLTRSARLECTYCKQKFNFPSVLKRHVRSHTNERPYVCQVCNKSFKQLGHLSQHGLTHTDYRSFNCTICTIKFESLDSLKLHSQTHKEDELLRSKDAYRLFECDSCKKVFTTKSVLERHIFTHSHERQFGCKVCGKRFKQAGHVKSHMLIHTGERKFECTVCSKRFSLSNSLKKHMYVHNGEKPYQCDVCGARFLEKRNLNGHLMTHTNERPFSCKICGKRYTLADTLRRHISAAHEDGRTYQCEICAKMFKQLAHLSVHKKVHNDERPFQCHLCDKNFKHKNVLKSHLAIHANVRPFECDVCKATFVRKTNLQTHIASAHMNERPYVCKICNKRFKQISHLNGHIVVHSNSMPYQCDFCDRRCNRLDNLKKHMRLHSKNKE